MRHDYDGYIYFVLADEVERVKIGYTQGVPRFRVDYMRTGSPVELRLARVIYGDRGLERDLHRYFSTRRVHREWFEASVLSEVDRAVIELTGYAASPPAWTYPTETTPPKTQPPSIGRQGFRV